jgi:hypothetical protein
MLKKSSRALLASKVAKSQNMTSVTPNKNLSRQFSVGIRKRKNLKLILNPLKKLGKNDWKGFTTFGHGKTDEKQQNSFLICKSFF